jgi:uncharacterized protein YdaU (DUF1376 family)
MAWSNRPKIRATVEQSIHLTETISKAPAFQFYPKDFLTDENVRVMSLQERGAYITLICLCWTEGSLPSDANRLARLCGIPSTMFRKLWPAIAVCFREAGDDRLIHPRLEREREKQTSYRRRQSDAATLRWSQRHATAVASYSQATSEPMPETCHRNALLSSSSSVDLKTSSEPTITAPEPKDTSPSLLTFPTIGAHGATWHLRETQAGEWRSLFPAVDVLGEARKALAWLQANPTKRKTAKGMPRFLVGWLSRCVDRGGNSTASVAVGRRVESREETDAYLANLRRDRDAARAEGGSWKFTDVANG